MLTKYPLPGNKIFKSFLACADFNFEKDITLTSQMWMCPVAAH